MLDSCLDRSGNTRAAARIIQACTESLDHKLLESDQVFFLFGSRAGAYFASATGNMRSTITLQPSNLAPHYGKLYYDREWCSRRRPIMPRRCKTSIPLWASTPTIRAALLRRAKLYAARGILSSALADYSKAISLQPNTAELWSDRGYVDLGQHDYSDAVKDEAQAIQLDPKLARAYYLRGVASADLGDRVNAVDDLHAAVGMDASLAQLRAHPGQER